MPRSEEIDRKGDPIVAMTSTISSNLIRLNLSDLWMHPNSFGCGMVGAYIGCVKKSKGCDEKIQKKCRI